MSSKFKYIIALIMIALICGLCTFLNQKKLNYVYDHSCDGAITYKHIKAMEKVEQGKIVNEKNAVKGAVDSKGNTEINELLKSLDSDDECNFCGGTVKSRKVSVINVDAISSVLGIDNGLMIRNLIETYMNFYNDNLENLRYENIKESVYVTLGIDSRKVYNEFISKLARSKAYYVVIDKNNVILDKDEITFNVTIVYKDKQITKHTVKVKLSCIDYAKKRSYIMWH